MKKLHINKIFPFIVVLIIGVVIGVFVTKYSIKPQSSVLTSNVQKESTKPVIISKVEEAPKIKETPKVDTSRSTNQITKVEETTKPQPTTQETPKTQVSEGTVSYENFLKISINENFPDVVALLGNNFYIESTTDDVTRYNWQYNGKGFLNVMVRNGIVVSKYQSNLSEKRSNVTLAQYNQIKQNMPASEVGDILGKGILYSMDSNGFIVQWINLDGGVVNVQIIGNRVDNAGQRDLK